MNKTDISGKKIYLEFMRIIACAFVIFGHSDGYSLFMEPGITGVKMYLLMSLSMIVRLCVPLFFMISGALLLKKDETVQQVLKKRVFRLVVVLAWFELVAFVVYWLDESNVSLNVGNVIIDYFRKLLNGTLETAWAYWYLYAFLGFLLVLPLMQRIAHGMKKQEFILLLVLNFIVCSFLPILNLILRYANVDAFELSNVFDVPFAFEEAFFLPLIGYYIENNIDIENIRKKHIGLLIIAGLLGIVLTNFCVLFEKSQAGILTQNYVNIFECLSAVVCFICIKYYFVVINPGIADKKRSKLICYMGSLTFGIYLIAPFIQIYFYYYFAVLTANIPAIISSIIWVVISMIIAGGITAILKKIPIIKKFI